MKSPPCKKTLKQSMTDKKTDEKETIESKKLHNLYLDKTTDKISILFLNLQTFSVFEATKPPEY